MDCRECASGLNGSAGSWMCGAVAERGRRLSWVFRGRWLTGLLRSDGGGFGSGR